MAAVVGDLVLTRQGKIEKHIMRAAFDTPEDVYLPQNILYRQKEQFSDGVGYSWIDELRAKAAEEVGMRWRRVFCVCVCVFWLVFGP